MPRLAEHKADHWVLPHPLPPRTVRKAEADSDPCQPFDLLQLSRVSDRAYILY